MHGRYPACGLRRFHTDRGDIQGPATVATIHFTGKAGGFQRIFCHTDHRYVTRQRIMQIFAQPRARVCTRELTAEYRATPADRIARKHTAAQRVLCVVQSRCG